MNLSLILSSMLFAMFFGVDVPLLLRNFEKFAQQGSRSILVLMSDRYRRGDKERAALLDESL